VTLVIISAAFSAAFHGDRGRRGRRIWAFSMTMFIYRDYRWRDLPLLLHRTLRTVAMVLT